MSKELNPVRVADVAPGTVIYYNDHRYVTVHCQAESVLCLVADKTPDRDATATFLHNDTLVTPDYAELSFNKVDISRVNMDELKDLTGMKKVMRRFVDLNIAGGTLEVDVYTTKSSVVYTAPDHPLKIYAVVSRDFVSAGGTI